MTPTQGEHAQTEALRPKFGDLLRNTMASEGNPRSDAYFIREVHRSGGGVNPGRWFEMTDGKGETWLSNPQNLVPATTPGEHAQTALAHELFAAAQLAPGEGIEDAVSRIAAALTAAPSLSDGLRTLREAILNRLSHAELLEKAHYLMELNSNQARTIGELQDLVEATPAQPAAPQGVAYAEPSEFPAGAIVNGRTHIDRLESFYSFDCEAGPLINCDDWHGLKRCFEHLAERASHGQAPAGAALDELLILLGSKKAWPSYYFNHKDRYECCDCGQEHDDYAEITHAETCDFTQATADRKRIKELVEILKASTPTAQAAPAAGAVAGPVETIKFSDGSTADPVEKARRYLNAMADHRINSQYFFDDGWPKKESAIDAMATLAVLEKLAAAPTPAAQADSAWSRALEIRMVQGWRLKGDRLPVLYTDAINGDQVCRDDLWLCTTAALASSAAQADRQQAPAGVAVGVVRWAAGIEGSQLEVRWKDGEAPPAGTQVYAQTTTAQAAPAAGAVAGPDDDDSLMLCASDLEHSAIYDNHVEMQSCIRAVAERVRLLAAAPTPAAQARIEKCAVCGDGNARLLVMRNCDVCGSDYAGQSESELNLALERARRAAQADSVLAECGNCFEGKSDFDHVCKHCGGSGKVADSVLENAARYQWLREKPGYDLRYGSEQYTRVCAVCQNYGADLDAAIDAARKQGGKHD